MAVTWKALAYQSAVDSAVASEGLVRSSADSSLAVAVAAAGTSTAISTADSKAVVADSKAVSAASIALSYTNSEGVVRSTADSSLTLTVATADSKGVSAASIALSYTNSEGLVRSAADSSLTVKPVNQFGTATGNLAMGGYQITDLVIHTVATTAAMTGLTAVVGKFAFNTADLSPYVCTASV